MEGRRSVLKVVTQEFPKKTEVSRCKEAGSFLAYDSHGNFLLTTERMFDTLGFQSEGPFFFVLGSQWLRSPLENHASLRRGFLGSLSA